MLTLVWCVPGTGLFLVIDVWAGQPEARQRRAEHAGSANVCFPPLAAARNVR